MERTKNVRHETRAQSHVKETNSLLPEQQTYSVPGQFQLFRHELLQIVDGGVRFDDQPEVAPRRRADLYRDLRMSATPLRNGVRGARSHTVLHLLAVSILAVRESARVTGALRRSSLFPCAPFPIYTYTRTHAKKTIVRIARWLPGRSDGDLTGLVVIREGGREGDGHAQRSGRECGCLTATVQTSQLPIFHIYIFTPTQYKITTYNLM